MPKLRINAWTGSRAVSGKPADRWFDWAKKLRLPPALGTLDSREENVRDWKDPSVGWGVVLAENERIKSAARVRADDAPAPIRELLAHRHGIVLRYRDDIPPNKIRRYYLNASPQDLDIVKSERGVGRGELPFYLLVYGGPERIPWDFEFKMGGSHLVGRLDLPLPALRNYVNHLTNNWSTSKSSAKTPVVWAVDWGGSDITGLMREVIADAIYERYAADPSLKPVYRTGEDATFAQLLEILRKHKPAMIVTTSHGQTGPPEKPKVMTRNLGLFLDANQELVDPALLLKRWQPDGAIWYAHACCSAGSDRHNMYRGLFARHTEIDTILRTVAGLGSKIAPLPQALLSADKPARAFIGHVQPTFDWPLQDPSTGQPMGGAVCSALWKHLYCRPRHPVGLAFREIHQQAAAQFQQWSAAVEWAGRARDIASRKEQQEIALRLKLGVLDWQSIVILGDPAVVLPPTKRTGFG